MLATVEDVCEREGLDPDALTDTQRTKIEKLLVDASAKVRAYTGQHFTKGESTTYLQAGMRTVVKLPQKPVIRIISVDDVPFTGSHHDFVAEGKVKVKYEHGFEQVPADIVSIVCGMVQRTMNIHAIAKTGVKQQSVGPYSISFADWATGGNLTLSPAERRELKKWKNVLAGSVARRY